MTMKSLAMMTVAAVLLIGAAWVVSQQQARAPADAARFFPDLSASLNEVSEVRISARRGTSTIRRREDTWGVREKHDYPADLGKVRAALIGLAEWDIMEVKTAKPEWHDKLGVLDVDAEGSSSTSVTLKDAAGRTLAEVIVGQARPARDRSGRREIFVRKVGAPQTWLVIGNLSAEPDPGEWLDKDILRIEPTRVRRVSVTHPDRTRLTLAKDTPGDRDHHVVGLPDGREVRSSFTVNNIVSTIASLSFEDVHPRGDVDVDGHDAVVATVETFDGFEGTVTLLRRDETNYVTVSAAFNAALVWRPEPEELPAPDDGDGDGDGEGDGDGNGDGNGAGDAAGTPPEPGTDAATPAPPHIKPADEVKADIDALTRTVADWVYVIPSFRADTILTTLEDLLASPDS